MPKRRRSLTRSEQMARIRSCDTRPELLLRKTLWNLGFRYRLRLVLPGRPDLAFVKEKVAVFVDGCFWHGCPKHYKAPTRNEEFWQQKLKRNTCRDRSVDAELETRGWKVVRLWEHEVVGSLGESVAKVKMEVEATRRAGA